MNSEADCLTERMNSIVLRLDIDGTVLSMNGYAVNFFGVDPSLCIGKKLDTCIRGGGSSAEHTIQSILHRVIKDPDHFIFSYGVIASAGGVEAWVSWTHRAIHNQYGGIDEVVLVGNEMTAYKQLEYDLKDTNERFKVMLESIQTGVLIIDPVEAVILYANNVAAAILGAPREEIIGEQCGTFCGLTNKPCFLDPSAPDMTQGSNYEVSFTRADGRVLHMIKNLTTVNFRGTDFVLESFIDITAKKQTEEHLLKANNQIENLLASIVSVMIGVAINDDITHWNKAAEELFGIRAENVMNTSFPNCGINWEWNRIYEAIADSILLEKITHLNNVEFIDRNGKQGYLDMTVNAIMDDKKEVTGFLLFGENVTEKELNKKLLEEIETRKKVEKELTRLNVELERLAKEDPLTRLANRRCFMEQFENEFRRARRYGSKLALMILDLDHFKKINDTHGHQAGDRVLVRFATEISAHIRSTDLAGRYGGEEFCMFLPEADLQQAQGVAEKLRSAVAVLDFEGETAFTITCSIGVTVMHADDADIAAVIRRADQALYEAKDSGRNRVVTRD